MLSFVLVSVLLIGVVISTSMFIISIKKNNNIWNLLTITYGIIVNMIDAFVNKGEFNVGATGVFILVTLLLGYLLAKLELRPN